MYKYRVYNRLTASWQWGWSECVSTPRNAGNAHASPTLHIEPRLSFICDTKLASVTIDMYLYNSRVYKPTIHPHLYILHLIACSQDLSFIISTYDNTIRCMGVLCFKQWQLSIKIQTHCNTCTTIGDPAWKLIDMQKSQYSIAHLYQYKRLSNTIKTPPTRALVIISFCSYFEEMNTGSNFMKQI